MPTDDFIVSVTNAVLTNLAAGRPWEVGAYIEAIGIYAPAAATSFEYGMTADGQEIAPRGTQNVGTAPSATPAAEHKPIDYTAVRQWRVPCLHSGAAAQNIRVQCVYEEVEPSQIQAVE